MSAKIPDRPTLEEGQINVLNAIRENASDAYKASIPVIEGTAITNAAYESLMLPLTQYTHLANEFATTLVNLIAEQTVMRKLYQNPLASLKSGSMPFGDSAQHIYVNPADDMEYDPSITTEMLALKKPDIKSIYHRRNRRAKYKVSISGAQLRAAFRSLEKLSELQLQIVVTLYYGDNRDEFNLTKHTVTSAALEGKLITVDVGDWETDREAFLIEMQNAVSDFKYSSTENNSYSLLAGAVGEVETFTELQDIKIMMPERILNTIKIREFAHMFNMSEADFRDRLILIDSFGYLDDIKNFVKVPEMLCIIFDVNLFYIKDTLQETSSFKNGENLATNIWWHHWQLLSLNLMCNARVLTNGALIQPANLLTDDVILTGDKE